MEATATMPSLAPTSVMSLIDQPLDKVTPLSLPSSFAYKEEELACDGPPLSNHSDVIPIIDVSLLISNDQKEIRKLGEACEDWGFFQAINHGVPEGLIERILDVCDAFFNMTEDEKRVYLGKGLSDPIFYGTGSSHSHGKALYWRDFLKIKVHPKFHSPTSPEGFRDVLEEYSEKIRKLAGQLLMGISESLGFEKTHISDAMDFDQGSQLFAANLYPRCPDPDNAIGLPRHTDLGLLTVLLQNDIQGLQVLHKGKWIQVKGNPGALFVNTCDQMEIFTNGKYKSVIHKAVVNGRNTRMSIIQNFEPTVDTFIAPSERLLSRENLAVAYKGMKFGEYRDLLYTKRPDGKTVLESLKIVCV